MKILITGIHGFVGSNLVEYLKAENEIYGLDIVTNEKSGVVKTFLWDELDAMPEFDAIIHLAGKAHDTKNKAAAEITFLRNKRMVVQDNGKLYRYNRGGYRY